MSPYVLRPGEVEFLILMLQLLIGSYWTGLHRNYRAYQKIPVYFEALYLTQFCSRKKVATKCTCSTTKPHENTFPLLRITRESWEVIGVENFVINFINEYGDCNQIVYSVWQ